MFLNLLVPGTVLSTSHLFIHSFYQQFLSVFCRLSAENSVVNTEGPVPVLTG